MRKFLLLLCLASLCPNPTYAKKWRVNNNQGITADFTSIITAHNAASPGDTLYIEGSVTRYDAGNTVNITKKLLIIGPGYFLTANDFTQANKQAAEVSNLDFEAGSDGSAIMGMDIRSLDVRAPNIIVQRNHIDYLLLRSSNSIVLQNYIGGYIQDFGGSGLLSHNIMNYMYSSYQNASYQIFNNVIFYVGSGNVLDVYNSEIRNNIILGPTTIDAARKSAITHNIFAQVGDNSNNNKFNVDMTAVFINGGSTDGKYQLKEGSPAKGAGLQGVDCGVFGGSTPYVLSGIPPGPSIYEASAPASAPKGAGLPVTLKIKSHN